MRRVGCPRVCLAVPRASGGTPADVTRCHSPEGFVLGLIGRGRACQSGPDRGRSLRGGRPSMAATSWTASARQREHVLFPATTVDSPRRPHPTHSSLASPSSLHPQESPVVQLTSPIPADRHRCGCMRAARGVSLASVHQRRCTGTTYTPSSVHVGARASAALPLGRGFYVAARRSETQDMPPLNLLEGVS